MPAPPDSHKFVAHPIDSPRIDSAETIGVAGEGHRDAAAQRVMGIDALAWRLIDSGLRTSCCAPPVLLKEIENPEAVHRIPAQLAHKTSLIPPLF